MANMSKLSARVLGRAAVLVGVVGVVGLGVGVSQVVSSGSGLVAAEGPGKVPAGGRVCWEAGAGGFGVYNVTPVLAGGGGDGQLVSSDVRDAPLASNVNFVAGSVDSNVAIVQAGKDGKVCFQNSRHSSVDVVIDSLGYINSDSFTPASSEGVAVREVDTRLSGDRVAAGGRICWEAAEGFGVYNVTPVLASGGGDGQLVSSDVKSPPKASNVNFDVGTVDPNVAIVQAGQDGKACFQNSRHSSVDVVIDNLGYINSDSFTPASSEGVAVREVDTRLSGDRVAAGGRICWEAAEGFGVYNVTPVLASGGGDGQLVSSDVKTPPKASNVNFDVGTVDPNVAIVQAGKDGKACFQNSRHSSVDVVIDSLGYINSDSFTPASPQGAAVRKLDTRTDTPTVPAPTTTTTTTTTTVPAPTECTIQGQTIETVASVGECNALIAIYNSNPNSRLKEPEYGWNQPTDPCTWGGVTCDQEGISKLILFDLDLPADDGFNVLPPEIGGLINLTELNLDYRNLSVLPVEIGQLTNLSRLSLWGNRLSELPSEIGKLTNLTELNLTENQLMELPASIGKLTNLTQLNAGENKLKTLPIEIGKLTNLFALRLYDNELSGSLDEPFAGLQQANTIQVLNLARNGCLTATTPVYEWLENLNSSWNDGCGLKDGSVSPQKG